MNNQNKEFLPIGTVVHLKKARYYSIVVGYKAFDNDTVYDYCGALYPMGIISKSKSLVFNHSDIEKVIFIGYKDQSFEDLMNIVNNEEILKKIMEEQNEE